MAPNVTVLAVYSPKGGVGKTSAVVNLAYEAAQRGKRVLVWDLDPQGAASFYLRVSPLLAGGAKSLVRKQYELAESIRPSVYPGLDVLPADFRLRDLDVMLSESKGRRTRLARTAAVVSRGYDLVFMDCPPTVSLLSENILAAADVLIVPVIPTTLSVRTLDHLDALLSANPNPPAHRCFFSQVDGRTRLHGETVEAVLAERDDVLRSVIPLVQEIELMGDHQAPVAASSPNGMAAAAYRDLWDEFWVSLNVEPPG